jgi:hypothetical protein
VARHLQKSGFQAAALVGGYKAWEALYPIEPKGSVGDETPRAVLAEEPST